LVDLARPSSAEARELEARSIRFRLAIGNWPRSRHATAEEGGGRTSKRKKEKERKKENKNLI